MSLRRFDNKKCTVCGKTDEYMSYSSMYISEADLDGNSLGTRYFNGVEKCKECGYCNFKIDQIKSGIKELVKSEKYIKQLNNEEYIEGINELLCGIMVNELVGYYVRCGFMYLICSWMYLNEGTESSNIKYFKEKAIEYFEKDVNELISSGHSLAYVDTIRQLGYFEKAMKFIEDNKKHIFDSVDSDMHGLLELEIKLLENKDSKIYTSNGIKKSEYEKVKKENEEKFEEYKEESFFEKIKNFFR